MKNMTSKQTADAFEFLFRSVITGQEGTFTPDRVGQETRRYIVSRKGGSQLGMSDPTLDILEAVHEVISNNPDAESFGTWFDDDGYIWLDANDSYHTLVVALKVASENGQLAIYDTWTSSAIDCKGVAK